MPAPPVFPGFGSFPLMYQFVAIACPVIFSAAPMPYLQNPLTTKALAPFVRLFPRPFSVRAKNLFFPM